MIDIFDCTQSLGESQQSPVHSPSSPNIHPRKDSVSNQLVASDTRSGVGRDFFSNISSDLNGFAAQTSSMFSDLFGMYPDFSIKIIMLNKNLEFGMKSVIFLFYY